MEKLMMPSEVNHKVRRNFKKIHQIQQKKIEALKNREFFSGRSAFGNDWAMFFIFIGAREAGKSYDVMKLFVKQWKRFGKPFTWCRLTEPSQKKLLTNNAEKFIDPDLRRKFDLELTVKGIQVYDHGKPMAKVLALSTFYNDKGVALYDNEYDLGYNICLDEMNRDKCEKNTFDIVYAFVNQMENLVRSTKEKVRIVLIGNDTQEASDILCSFNFIPESFGRYYIRKKRAVIDYMQPTEAYLKRRKGTVADLLTPTASTFTNKQEIDKSLVFKGRLKKPTKIIKFTMDKDTWFTMWDGKVVRRYNNERVRGLPMRHFLEDVFIPEERDAILAMYDARSLLFRDLITQKKFKAQLILLKGTK